MDKDLVAYLTDQIKGDIDRINTILDKPQAGTTDTDKQRLLVSKNNYINQLININKA